MCWHCAWQHTMCGSNTKLLLSAWRSQPVRAWASHLPSCKTWQQLLGDGVLSAGQSHSMSGACETVSVGAVASKRPARTPLHAVALQSICDGSHHKQCSGLCAIQSSQADGAQHCSMHSLTPSCSDCLPCWLPVHFPCTSSSLAACVPVRTESWSRCSDGLHVKSIGCQPGAVTASQHPCSGS